MPEAARPLADLGDQDRRHRTAAGDARRARPTSITTMPATCPTAGSSSIRPAASRACPASAAATRWPTCASWTPTARTSRQLCFDQDHDWCPTLLNDGRVLYSRWEYTDTPHYFTRLLFHMNPDGTNQIEYYKSNSPWPNSTFYATAHSRPSDQGRGRHLRPSRRAADGRVDDLRPGQGTVTRRRGPSSAFPATGQGGQAGHRRSDRRELLAQVPAPLSAQREVFPCRR